VPECYAAAEAPGAAASAPGSWQSRAVQLRDHPTTEPVRKQVDTDQGGTDGPSGVERKRGGLSGRVEHGSSHATERDVGTPLALRGHSVHGPDDPPGRHQDPQVVSLRRYELLDDRTMPVIPAIRTHTGESLRERHEVVAPVHLPAPAPVARLQHDRMQRLRHASSLPDVHRRRMRDGATPKHSGSQQLVVGREQRSGVVQDVNASCGERPQRPEPVVHAVEGGKHVQTTERRVAGTHGLERTPWGHRLPGQAVGRRIRERVVRRRRSAGD